ncbi:MAG TPA: ABC transporter ATP-binding protein [Thermoanaerobaculia bacterium]|nr:ABC transporter ATP-binding protein [Thermoanaerobaculia bacterium]
MRYAIRAQALTKNYEVYDRPIDRLLEALTRRPRHKSFSALEGVTFDVRAGETIGLIGENGAGKSTLLKLLCGVTAATSGTLEIAGSIASILELGAGFHPEFSGRDNAALNAAVLGLSPSEIREALPLILEFSELGDFLDRPVKTYSSGMYMRLAFSVAVNVDPDILVIDEALAVGDGHFQKKCVDKIRDFQQRGKTIFFCSHALYYISTLCERTLWLDHGTLRQVGPSIDVVHAYETALMERDRQSADRSPGAADRSSPVQIRSVTVADRRGKQATEFNTGDDIQLHVVIESVDPGIPIHLMAGVLRAADETQCFAVGTHADVVEPFSGQTLYEVIVSLKQVPLLRGDYAVVVFAGDENAIHVYDRKDVRPAFSMRGERFEIGMMSVDHTWHVSETAQSLAR